MKILLTVPDTIGDFVMRQPLFEALISRGHELSIVLRPFLTPIAPLVAPGVRLLSIDGNPYAPWFQEEAKADLENLSGWLEKNKPDVLVVTPYQWTALEEAVAALLPDVPSVGMSGIRYRGSIVLGEDIAPALSFTHVVEVREEDSEFRKNEALCRAILSEPVVLPPPKLVPTEELMEEARANLAELLLEPGRFWVACMGHSEWTAVKNRDLAAWAQTCRALLRETGHRILFVGTPNESETVGEIARLLEDVKESWVNVCDRPVRLDLLAAVTSLSFGYVGKDTGPMHIAAAMGRPVVAVFGGGHWPRFVPEAAVGRVLTQLMPCAGCDWVCHLSRNHCVKGVPTEAVDAALRAVAAGADDFQVLAVEPDAERLRELCAEAGREARERMRVTNRSITLLREEKAAADSQLNGLYQTLATLRDEKAATDAQVQGLHRALATLREEKAAIETQLNAAYQELAAVAARLDAVSAEYRGASAQLDAVRRSTFTRLLQRLGIWKLRF